MGRQIVTMNHHRNHHRAPSTVPGPALVREHGRLDRACVPLIRLRVTGPGDDARALTLRQGVENLLDCGPARLLLDVSSLDDASCLFIRILADLITSAASRGCAVSLVGLDSPALLEAIFRAPLDQLVSIVRSSQVGHEEPTEITATLPPNAVR
jgi:anti-anti-sigma regulatory factor